VALNLCLIARELYSFLHISDCIHAFHQTVDKDLALKIFIKARASPKVVAAFAQRRDFDKILIYSKQVQYESLALGIIYLDLNVIMVRIATHFFLCMQGFFMSHDRYACSKSHSKIHVTQQKVISKGLGDTFVESNCFQQWRSMRALHFSQHGQSRRT
jgi:hypothetical protein